MQSGEYSNLRWDIPPDQVLFYYDDVTLNNDTTAISNLVDLGKGLAGGGSLPRSKYIFEWINLPKVMIAPNEYLSLGSGNLKIRTIFYFERVPVESLFPLPTANE